MNNDDLKRKKIGAFCVVAVLVLAALGVLTGRGVRTTQTSDSVCLFDGWIYGREDQKRANAALSSAGLNEYAWRDGRLYAPRNKKDAYMSALSTAGAYPRAPSEARTDAVKEMSAFESDSKTRMRELNACAIQLERTIEQMRGVEYATVGARARREQAGLSTKTIVTASVGVACQDDFELGPSALAAITLATKHQLGIDDVEQISILDLKEGKSYVGVESFMKESDVALEMEKERLEKYWREKYLEAFGDIKKLRVSVSVDVAPLEDEAGSSVEVERTEKASGVPEGGASKLAMAPILGRFETLRPAETNDFGDDVESSEASNAPDVELDEAEPRGAATINHAGRSDASGVPSGGFALLGNPKRGGERVQRRGRPASIWAQYGARPIPEASASVSARPKLLQTALERSLGDEDGGAVRSANVGAADSARGNGRISSGYAIRSISARIAIPRSYVQAAALRNFGEGERPETFAENNAGRSVYLATEERIIAETQRFTIDLMRPTGERYGWSEEDLKSWIVVAVFSDLDSFADSNAFARSEHKTSYASTGEEGFVGIEDESTSERRYVATDPSGAITEVAPTVAKELSTERLPEVENSAPDASVSPLVLAKRWAKVNVFARLDSVLGRNFPYRPVFGAAATFIVLCVTIGVTRRLNRRTREELEPARTNRGTNREESFDATSRASRSGRETREPAREMEYSDFDDDEFDFRAYDERPQRREKERDERERGGSARSAESEFERATRKRSDRGAERGSESQRGGYNSKRVETLDLIARYPERAAESLQRWVKKTDP